jgi:DNA polymerase-3 subunit beta
MKIKCSIKPLAQQLEKLSSVCNSKYSDVLTHVLVNADTEIKLSATDLSTSIKTKLIGEIIETGNALLPCKQLIALLKVLVAKEVTLDVSSQECLVLTETGRYRLDTLPAEDFPELDDIVDGDYYTFTPQQLTEGFKAVLYSASTDETKQILCGVNVQIANGLLAFATTDSHRLALTQNADNTNALDNWFFSAMKLLGVTSLLDKDVKLACVSYFRKLVKETLIKEFTIHEKTCSLLLKLITKTSSDVKISFNGSTLKFTFDGLILTSRLLEGTYPKYQQLIPRQFDRQVCIDRAALFNAVENIQIISAQKNNGIHFETSFTRQELILTSQETDAGVSKIALPAQITGEDIKTGFECDYLLDALKNLSSTEIQISLNAPLTPVVIEPLSADNVKYLVMPLQIRE